MSGVVVVAELTSGQEIIPVILLLTCEHMQIALQLLVYVFIWHTQCPSMESSH
jgi:hypothetical protein